VLIGKLHGGSPKCWRLANEGYVRTQTGLIRAFAAVISRSATSFIAEINKLKVVTGHTETKTLIQFPTGISCQGAGIRIVEKSLT